MILTFVGRRHQEQNSKPTARDALVVLSQLPPKKVCRLVARSLLNFGDEIDDDPSKHPEEVKKLGQEIAQEEVKTKERLKIRGMIYFNTESAEVLQVMEGKPQRLHEAMKHFVRDVRHKRLHIQIEFQKVKKRYTKWGSVYASSNQQWKLVRLMLPTEDEWKRLVGSIRNGEADSGDVSFSRRDSLTEAVEAKKLIMEDLGPDCKRIWRRRDSMCTTMLPTQELRYLRQRHDIARTMLQNGQIRKGSKGRTGTLFSCFDDPDVIEQLEIKRKRGRGDEPRPKNPRRNSVVSTSRSSRISISRSSILEVLSAEEGGFVENMDEMYAYIETLKAKANGDEKAVQKYDRKNKKHSRKKTDPKAAKAQLDATVAILQNDEKTSGLGLKLKVPGMDIPIQDDEGSVPPVSPTSPSVREANKFEDPTSPISDHNNVTGDAIERATIAQKQLGELMGEPIRAPPKPPKAMRAARVDQKRTWSLIQAIGPDENAVAGSTSQDDYVTSLQLDPSGNYIAIGDSQGRIGIFDASETAHQPEDPYQFYEEFVSHHPDFDTLYSRKIPTNIIAVEWLRKESKSLHVLATNEKTIKLWRLKEVQKDNQPPNIIPVLCKEYSKGHQRFFIHSLSSISDGETFISSDELMLNMWHLERPDSHFCLIDDLPEQDDMVEVNRIITSAKADPELCYRFLYTTSVNEVNICDLRARCMQNRPQLILQSAIKASNMSPEVSRELQCITDADFALDGYRVVTRSFSSVRMWDLRYPSRPNKTISVHENNPALFTELCNNGCLVDDFRVAVNRDATGVVTGSYDDYFAYSIFSSVAFLFIM